MQKQTAPPSSATTFLTNERAAQIKYTSASTVRSAAESGTLLQANDHMIVWDEAFEAWNPPVTPSTVSRINESRPWTKTIRFGDRRELMADARRTAREIGVCRFDLVPVNPGNADMLLSIQRGSLDGNVDNPWLRREVAEALEHGEPVYQKRIHTEMDCYHQSLHPSPRVVLIEDILAEPGITEKRLMKACKSLRTFVYERHLFVLLDEAYREWVASLRCTDSPILFSPMMLRA